MASAKWLSVQDLMRHAATSIYARRLVLYSAGCTALPTVINYSDFYTIAEEKSQILNGLLGFAKRRPVMLHLHDSYDLPVWFGATMLADGLPVPSPPLSSDPHQRKNHLEGLSKLLDSLICIARTIDATSTKSRKNIKQYSLAMLMLTSGSTGNAKASSTRQLPSGRPLLNWIGLDYVASLVEVHMQALFFNVDQVHVQSADVLSRPRLFLDLLSIYQVLRSFAPNFFLAKLISAILTDNDEQSLYQWDLSNLTDIVSGGEANDVQTCVSITELLASYGAPWNVLTIRFGITETYAGAIYNTQCPKNDIANGRLFASLGKCIPGVEMRITKDPDEETGNVVLRDAGEPGNLEVRGAVVFRGYYRNEKDTAEAFTRDGWFRTGDTGVIDSTGNLSLCGRIKDIVNINGVKVGGAELQASLETAVGSQAGHTEQVSIAYIPKRWPMKTEDVVNINDKLAKVCLLLARSRPPVFSLRDKSILPKSSLGKISRAKMKSLLGTSKSYRLKQISLPMTEEAARLLEDFASVLEIRPDKIGVDTPFYDFGITSIDIVRLKRRVDQRLSIDIPMVTLVSSPTVRALASALDYSPLQNGDSVAKQYDPVVKFRSTGSKTPLWCIYPSVGEVLVSIGLAKHIADDNRPIFALRARGFDAGQSRFKSIAEAVKTFNLPPNIKIRMQKLNFNVCLLHLLYFLGLVTKEYADSIKEKFRELPNAMAQLMGVADRNQMVKLNLSEKKLAHWAEITFRLQSIAQEYEPGGKVKSMDVFRAIPFKAAAKSREDGLENYLKKWEDFSEMEPRFYQLNGAHYTMIGPDHVASFAGTLKKALRARGL
ncbi:acyl-protein synthetase [Xylaria grammica]|nr:acyl-protein synthetase [Xylaria grammica]